MQHVYCLPRIASIVSQHPCTLVSQTAAGCSLFERCFKWYSSHSKPGPTSGFNPSKSSTWPSADGRNNAPFCCLQAARIASLNPLVVYIPTPNSGPHQRTTHRWEKWKVARSMEKLRLGGLRSWENCETFKPRGKDCPCFSQKYRVSLRSSNSFCAVPIGSFCFRGFRQRSAL